MACINTVKHSPATPHATAVAVALAQQGSSSVPHLCEHIGKSATTINAEVEISFFCHSPISSSV
jgi:hypothetical protein